MILGLEFFCAACGGSSAGSLGLASPSQNGEPEQVAIVLPSPSPAQAAVETPDEAPPSLSTSGSSWPMFHGDIGRRGWSNAPAIQHPALKWRAHIGIQGWLNSPVFAGDLVLVPSSGSDHNTPDPKDGVYALQWRTGRMVWHAHLNADANGIAATADRAIVTCDDGNIYAIELKSGRILWTYKGHGKVYSQPLPLGNFVVVGDAGGTLHALLQADGKPLWTAQLKGEIRGGAAADEAQVYAISTGGEAIALQWNGREVWRQRVMRPSFGGGRSVPIQVYSTPIVYNSTILVPFARDTYYDDPAFVSLDKKTGKTVWTASGRQQNENWGNIRSTPVLSDRGMLVYAEPYSGDIVLLDAKNGSVKSRRTVGACFFPQWASPAAASDTVYVPRFDGVVYAVAENSGQVRWQFYLGEESRAGTAAPAQFNGQTPCGWDVLTGYSLYSPAAVADDGTLLLGSAEGVLYAIGEKN